MGKADIHGSSHVSTLTERAAQRVSGIQVTPSGINVLTDAHVGAYCDAFGKQNFEQRQRLAQETRSDVQNAVGDQIGGKFEK